MRLNSCTLRVCPPPKAAAAVSWLPTAHRSMSEGAGWRLNRLARGVKLSAAGGEAACGLSVDAWKAGLSIIQMPLGALHLLAPASMSRLSGGAVS